MFSKERFSFAYNLLATEPYLMTIGCRHVPPSTLAVLAGISISSLTGIHGVPLLRHRRQGLSFSHLILAAAQAVQATVVLLLSDDLLFLFLLAASE